MTDPPRSTSLINRVSFAAAALVVLAFWAVLEIERR